jgi:hypothetical protein
MSSSTILERELTTFRPKDGNIESVKVIQTDDSKWYINIGVSWKTRTDFDVCLYDKRILRKYTSVDSAVRHICQAYDYYDRIMIFPKKRQV